MNITKTLQKILLFSVFLFGLDSYSQNVRPSITSEDIRDIQYCSRHDDQSVLENIALYISRTGNQTIVTDVTYEINYHFTDENGVNSNPQTVRGIFYGNEGAFSLNMTGAPSTLGEQNVFININSIKNTANNQVTFFTPTISRRFTVPQVFNRGMNINPLAITTDQLDVSSNCFGNSTEFSFGINNTSSLPLDEGYNLIFKTSKQNSSNPIGETQLLNKRFDDQQKISGFIESSNSSFESGTTYRLTLKRIQSIEQKCFFVPNGIVKNFTLNASPRKDITIPIVPGGGVCLGGDVNLQIEGLRPNIKYDVRYLLSGTNNKAEDTENFLTDNNGSLLVNITSEDITAPGATKFELKKLTAENTCSTDYTKEISFTVVPPANITSENISLPPATCINENAPIKITNPSLIMPLINYDIKFSIRENNLTESITREVTATDKGSLNFNIDGLLLTKKGDSPIVISEINPKDINCTSDVNITLDFFVDNPSLAIDEILVDNACSGEANVTLITNGGLSPGNQYSIEYVISGANSVAGKSEILINPSMRGNFLIPKDFTPNKGTNTIKITAVKNVGTQCGPQGLNLEKTFKTIRLDEVPFNLSVEDLCNSDKEYEVTIDGTSKVSGGSYNLKYNIKGANNSGGEQQAIIPIVKGSKNAKFMLPSDYTTNNGDTTLNLTSITEIATNCEVSFDVSIKFNIAEKPTTPQIIDRTQIFCKDEDIPFSSLTKKLTPGYNGTVTWYTKKIGGDKIKETDILKTAIVYAETNTESCISDERLKVNLEVSDCDLLKLPSSISPNGDGINDVFEIVNMTEIYPNYKLTIFDRTGRVIFKGDATKEPFKGIPSPDADVKGKLLQGVYYYIIEYNNLYKKKPTQGYFYLNNVAN